MRLFSFVNLFLVFVAASIWVAFACYSSKGEEPMVLSLPERKELPKNPFRLPDATYENLGEGALALRWEDPKIELPDLRSEIAYYGRSERPDLKEKGIVHLGLKSTGESQMIEKGKPIYLLYEPGATKGRYHFSKNPTTMWVEAEEPSSDCLSLALLARDESNLPITQPKEYSHFKVQKEEFGQRHNFFEMAGIRADTSLLYRQKAHFVGPDRFFERHGGKEYSFTQNRERLDFEDEEGLYSCFIREGDSLIWKESRWQSLLDSKETEGFPLLFVKRIDDKMITFDLWDVEGKIRINLNLPRDCRTDTFPDISSDFKFIGAKTWAQFIVDCRGERTLLRLNEWLLLTSEGWQKIEAEKQLNDYLEGRVRGPLFVLDKWEKREGKQYLLGHLFNDIRNDVKEIELPVSLRCSEVQSNAQPQAETPS